MESQPHCDAPNHEAFFEGWCNVAGPYQDGGNLIHHPDWQPGAPGDWHWTYWTQVYTGYCMTCGHKLSAGEKEALLLPPTWPPEGSNLTWHPETRTWEETGADPEPDSD